jgi:hypothetical protein
MPKIYTGLKGAAHRALHPGRRPTPAETMTTVELEFRGGTGRRVRVERVNGQLVKIVVVLVGHGE